MQLSLSRREKVVINEWRKFGVLRDIENHCLDQTNGAMEKEAAAFVRSALARTVELSPAAIDDALIEKAVRETSRRKEQ